MRHLLIPLLLMASSAHAENWLQVADLSPKGGVLLVDTASIDRSSSPRTARFKSVYSADRPMGDVYSRVSPDVRSFRWELSLGQFDCAARTIAIPQSVLYGADDQVVGKLDVDHSPLKIGSVAPQSIGGFMLETVCASTSDEPPMPGLARIKRLANPDDFYPLGAKGRGERGSPVVKVCVGPSGALLREPELTDTSGYPDLDSAAIKAAMAMRYAPAVENGVALPESCIKYKIKFGPSH